MKLLILNLEAHFSTIYCLICKFAKNLKAMKSRLLSLLFVLFTFMNTGCLSYLQIQKTRPPEITLNDDERSLQFVNFYDYNRLDFDNEERTMVYISGVNQLIEGIKRTFGQNPDFVLFADDSLVRGKARVNFEDPLAPDSVKFFCSKNRTDMLLALEAYDIYYDKDIVVNEDEDGKKSKTADYYLVVRPGLTLYDKNGNIINSSLLYAEEYIDSRSVILLDIAIRPSYAKRKEEIDRMSFDLGTDYINKFYPTDYLESRSFYTGKNFKPIIPYMQQHNWQQAIDMLLPLAASSDPKEARRAAKNLAVAYEGKGDMESAEKWYSVYDQMRK